MTFRDPELWKVQAARRRDAAGRLRRHPDREPLRRVLHRSLRRGAQARHSVDRRCRSRDVAARGAAHRVFASGVLERAAAGDRRGSRRRRGAEEDRQADPVVPGGNAGRAGHDLARRARGHLQETPAFPVHTVDTLGAGDVFHGAFALAITEKQESARGASGSPPPPQR